MKTTIIIALLALCACNEIQQLPKNHTTVETFKKSKYFEIDKSYPEQWRKNAVEGDKEQNIKFYKLSFTDKDGQIRITKHCYQCMLQHNDICVYIQHRNDFFALFRAVYDAYPIPLHEGYGIVEDHMKKSDIDAFFRSQMLIKYRTYFRKPNYVVFNGEKMKLITPEMEKELHAKELNV